MALTSEAIRPVTQAEIDTYARDGAVRLSRIMPIEWVELVRDALEAIRSASGHAEFYGEGLRSFSASMTAVENKEIWRYVTESPAPAIAGAVHRATQLQYFLDQIFCKEPGPITPTPWHQDAPYFSESGNDSVRVYLPVDPAPRSIGLEFVRGSHRWGLEYRRNEVPIGGTARPADGSPSVQDLAADPAAPRLPDISGNRDAYDIVSWDVELGDVIVFCGEVVHGAGTADNYPRPRWAIGVTYVGPEERYVERPENAIPDIAITRGARIPSGDLLSDHPDLCPVVWTA